MTAPNQASLPYLGSKISLLSNTGIRYEGILYTINTQESTVALQNVRSFGSEGRKTPDVPPSREVFDFIIFRGKDIKDITVCEPPIDDPAIVTVNVNPTPDHRMMSQAPSVAVGLDAPPPQPSAAVMSPAYADRYDAGNRMSGDRYGNNYDRYPQRGGMGRMQNQRGMQQNVYGGLPTQAPRGDVRGHGPRGGFTPMNGGYNMPRRYGSQSFHRGGARGRNHIVGELRAQPNQLTKQQMRDEFDFEGANSKFEKPKDMKKEFVEKGLVQVREGYDKNMSFFDSISCETLDRQAGLDTKIDRDKQRLVDSETFGASAVQKGRYRQGRRGGGYRGRGYAYGGNYGGNMYGGGGGGYPHAQGYGGGYRGYGAGGYGGRPGGMYGHRAGPFDAFGGPT